MLYSGNIHDLSYELGPVEYRDLDNKSAQLSLRKLQQFFKPEERKLGSNIDEKWENR